MTNGDNDPRQRNVNLLLALSALLTGSIVFFPSIVGLVKPPYAQKWLLAAFWLTATVGLLVLAVTVYLLRFTTAESIPHRRIGLAFWSSVAALLSLAFYVGINIRQDRLAPPEISAAQVSPVVSVPGEMITLSGAATDQDGDQLHYTWFISEQKIGSSAVVNVPSPSVEGDYEARLVVDDGRSSPQAVNHVQFRVKKKEASMANGKQLLQQALETAISQLRRKNTRRAKSLVSLQTSAVLDQLVQDFNPADAMTQQRLIQAAVVRAAETLPEKEWNLLLKGIRPCCSDFPGIYPLCNPDC